MSEQRALDRACREGSSRSSRFTRTAASIRPIPRASASADSVMSSASRTRQQEGISEWRERTARIARTASHEARSHHEQQEQPSEQRRGHREERPQVRRPRVHHQEHRVHQPSFESLRSISSSDEGKTKSSSKRDRSGAQSSLKYLVRGFLKACRGTKDEGRKASADGDPFFPSPQVTFLIDQLDNLVCQICVVTPLKMAISAEDETETIPACLPCGHLAYQGCMSSWLDLHRNCPFCREKMVYGGCGHGVKPTLIAHDTIHSLPRTLAPGGTIGNKCHPCRDKDRRESALKKWQSYAETFKAARAEFERLATDEAKEAMEVALKRLERAPKDVAYDTLASSHATW
ncbi:Uu.00g023230.m01.CDS01 [Anthostomella pinea]|uniref:Uu.00g023230.m01.CDS01 n=1 Tax=Anthostomella pinea TaxID=933095 RepID=A0AAI8W0N4_9PEZI|nr:Uu.00g023230.m01.CDS01 [Anthostomella pinea]